MKKYNAINNWLGWVAFAIAAVTYLLTIEPTASFWDCPEFIVQGTKLEVGHPPGNPIFMLTARFFVTLLGGLTSAAVAVNVMSALLSAATILLLFWSVTHLSRRLMVRDGSEPTAWQTVVIMAAGFCGALAYTWSDTFWFSAVEGEVYAFSSFCTALVFWLMLKWENRADSPGSDRYLVLIAYVIGVSIGVHLLNLLCIPALGLIYYFRKAKNVDALGSLIALGVSCVIVAAILYGLVPGIVQMAQWFELFFVNSLGMGYNMGVLIYAVLMLAVTAGTLYVIYSTSEKEFNDRLVRMLMTLLTVLLSGMVFVGHSVLLGIGIMVILTGLGFVFMSRISRRMLAMIVLSIGVIFVGYSSYALLLIRATASTPMNQNAPDNVFALSSYLNREQYGDRPLFMGPVFTEALEEFEYPNRSGNYYIEVDDQGRPKTRVLDGYLRDEQGAPFNNEQRSYTKVVKTSPDQPDRYVKEISRPDYRTMPDLNMLFTRIYSTAPEHVPNYKSWAGYTTPDIYNIPRDVREQWAAAGFVPRLEALRYLPSLKPVTTYVDSVTHEPVLQELAWKPGFDVNMRYFVNYQLNHMYWRYFMWNFAGRQNDFQGNGEPHLGNWISGIPFVDNARLGDQSVLPEEFTTANKGHNVFYMLPLLLGLFGLLMQALYRGWANEGRGIEQFWVVFFLFFMTGVAIVLYLNQTPGQPRERDYAFAGSFYAFAIWMGLAIPALALLLRSVVKKDRDSAAMEPVSAAVACAVALCIPLQMVSQTWDDHDRSGRYTTRDFGFNYLSSVDPNGIIFTNGDNDTFPLWYAQEVEGYRTDVRVVNLSYLTTDWYATQQTHPTYEAAPVPMLATPRDWQYERLAYNFVLPVNSDTVDVRESLAQLYASDASVYGAPILSSPYVYLPTDLEAALKHYSSGDAAIDSAYIEPYLYTPSINLAALGRGINQSRVLSLDMIANSLLKPGERPVYFASTVPSSYYLNLTPYMSATGLANEVTPLHQTSKYNVTAQKSYANMVTNYRWGGLDEPGADLYLDETVRRMVSSVRMAMLTIAENLLDYPEAPATAVATEAARTTGIAVPANQGDMARQLLDLAVEKLPAKDAPYDGLYGLYLARAYYNLYVAQRQLSDLEKAEALALEQAERYAAYIKWGSTLDYEQLLAIGNSELYAMNYLGEALAIANRAAMIKADPSLLDDPEYSVIWANANSFDVTDDFDIVPIVYINGFTLADVESEMPNYSGGSREILRKALSLLVLHERTGVEPMALSNDFMERYGFTAAQWDRLNR